jgi:hypothetical protein
MFRHSDNFSADDGAQGGPAISLAQQLRDARGELHQAQPPAHVLPAVMATFDQLHSPVAATAKPALRHRCRAWLVAVLPVPADGPGLGRYRAACVSACLLATATGLIVMMQPAPQATQPGIRPTSAPAPLSATFVPLVPPGRMAGYTAAWLVPAELSHANLASLGAPFDPSRANETVHAELLVNARGDVLAVRLP